MSQRRSVRGGMRRLLAVAACGGGLLAGMLSLAADPVSRPAGAFFRKARFLRADTNADGTVNITDPIRLLRRLFLGGAELPCERAADADADGGLNLSDAIYPLNFLFLGGPAPPPPGPTECGIDPQAGDLDCQAYPACPNDFPLIAHVVNRITFGATEDLYTRIQTREDLIRYIDEQLDQVPAAYDPAVHEPALHARVEALDIGFPSPGDETVQAAKLKASLLAYALESKWQLFHVVAQFWNNHFHTQLHALAGTFFAVPPQGAVALEATLEMFQLVDTDPRDDAISEQEWNAVRAIHRGAAPWELFLPETRSDGHLTLEEFLGNRAVAYWKYALPGDMAAVAADLESREYDLYRRLSFGRFRDLLEACSKSVAMLIYLNGFENTVKAPNENFAREILELFSVGVDSNYTQRDIEELAKVFTGWTIRWVPREGYAADDINFQGRPETLPVDLDLVEPAPLAFPTQEFWDDERHTWAFGLRPKSHDWARKDLFLQRYGGVDSLGNPIPASAELAISERTSDQTVDAALSEFDAFLDRLLAFRDNAKFISTKLIQLFVTDDLSLLAKDAPMPDELRQAFTAVDRDGDGAIEPPEWKEPIPLVLPNGRPPEVFERLDADADGRVTPIEYQEPDLLQACIDTWERTGGDQREVIRTILRSDEFLSLKFYRAKIKTPFEAVSSAFRLLGGSATNEQLQTSTNDMLLAGMRLFNFADPTGESELGEDWMHTIGLLERLKHLSLAAHPSSPAEARFDWRPGDLARRWGLEAAEEVVDFFTLLLHNGDVLPNHRALALAAFGAATPEPDGTPVAEAVRVLLSLPQFQKQ